MLNSLLPSEFESA